MYANWIYTLGVPIRRRYRSKRFFPPNYCVEISVWEALDRHFRASKTGTLFPCLQTVRWSTRLVPHAYNYLLEAARVHSLQLDLTCAVRGKWSLDFDNEVTARSSFATPELELDHLVRDVIGLFSFTPSQLTTLALEMISSDDLATMTTVLSMILDGKLPGIQCLLLGIVPLPGSHPCKTCVRAGRQVCPSQQLSLFNTSI